MADKTNPTANNSKASNFLPRFYRTDANKKFLQATIDQLIQPGTVKKVNGYVGRQNSKSTNGQDIFVAAADVARQNYQLEPGLTVKDKLGNNIFFKDYLDYINQLSVFGANTSNHARLTEQEFYSWNPHIDWDKFVNFQNYYWLPYGPDTIKVYGQQQTINSTFSVSLESQLDSYEYLFTPTGSGTVTRNPTITLYRGQTYYFEVNSPGNPFSIKTTRTAGTLDRYATYGLQNNAIETGTITFTIPVDCPSVLYYQSESDIDLGGVFHVLDIDENTYLNIEQDILGKKTYTLADGTELSNGMKVTFLGKVLPESYAVGQYYVEGVGDSITLVNESTLELVSAYTTSEAVPFDTTPFDKSPFSDATAFAGAVDYIVIDRASTDHNPWSRYNRWFHKDVIETSATVNGKVASIDQTARAVRPIIEFDANLRLFNFGTNAVEDVDLIDTFTTDVFSTIEGSSGYSVDGVQLVQGQKILFTADTDVLVKNRIYQVTFMDLLHQNISGVASRQIHLIEVSQPSEDQAVLVKQGNKNAGVMYWYNGSVWKQAQQKTTLNQSPLFDVVDDAGVSFSDISKYDGTTFAGTKIFSYKVGSGTNDTNLGFPLSYKNINNIGDIVFNFNLITDQFKYKNELDLIVKNIDTGYLVKTTPTGIAYKNGWETSQAINVQSGVRIYKNSNLTNNFNIDVFDDVNNLADLSVRVYVNGVRLENDEWSVVSGPIYKKVVLVTDITTSDVLTIKTFASQPINSNGHYEVPVNLQNNPLNDAIGDFTLGEVIDHVSSIVENVTNFVGKYPGAGNLRDLGEISKYGTKFVQHSGPMSLSAYHITSESNNVVRAIEQARDDYNKFKRNFISIAESLGVDTDTVTQVSLILKTINQDKPKTAPYYFSDMVPYGAYVKTDITVVDYRTKVYPLGNPFSLDVLSNKAVNVYLNGEQLLHSHDYTFDGLGFVIISATLANDDLITIYEYESTDGNFVPETPSVLGIWPKYEPKIFVDTSLITPRTMIQGHDGSLILAYGDYRDDLILELEKRIYNNIKVKYDSTIFDINDIIPSYNRTTDYSLTEFNEVLAPNFYKWTSLIDRDFTKPFSYDKDNSFTFNYKGHQAPDGRETPGYWRGIYRWILDTDRPNLCPWEMLGLSEEPDWWTTVYGPAPYTSDNLVMWQDIANGFIKEPGQPQVYAEKFAKPFLMEHIPVDENGNIVSPLFSGLSEGIITTSITGDFVFGDVSPIESAWRRSSHYPFSVLITAMLLKPAKTFGLLLDRSRIVRNLTNQLVYKETGLRVRPADIVLPSIYSSATRVQTSGIINYLVNYILSDNLKSYTSYAYDLANLNCQLSHRLGAFTSKEKFNLLLDSKTPLSSSSSVFVPQEDYDIILNSSSPIKKITYSGVIITKLQDGFEIKGYSKSQPYFKYYPWVQSGISINVGGISESFSVWTSGKQYASGKVVEYGNRFYRVKTTHTTTATFQPDYYQSLPSLPIVGGRNATLRKQWDRQDPITVPYGTKFREVQEVVDFLLGYGEWLKDQGFIFDEFNNSMAQVTNWETSTKEFLFWTTQNWSSGQDKWDEWLPNTLTRYGSIVRYNGDYYSAIRNSDPSPFFVTEDFEKLDGLSTVGSSVISLSPAATKLTFTASISVVDDITNSFNTYDILRVDGTPIQPNFLNSYRDDNAVSYAPSTDDGIYGASFYLVQKEQVVILNNSTMFNDTIYSPESGYKQDRIKVSGYVSDNWYGGFDVPGFIFDQAYIEEWEAWKDYALGDIVKHKEFYYSAGSFLVGTQSFESASWIKLDSKPSPQLLPNWTYKASQFEDFYSLDSDNFDLSQQKMAQHLIGYQKRQYLENIIQDDVSEFKFYQGMIIEKGTQNVLNKLFDVLSADGEESLKFYEEWALRVGQYGASSAFENIEFTISEAGFKNNPQGYELVNSIDENVVDFINRQTPADVYLKPLGYNNNPWPTLKNYKPYLRSAGYVRPDDVKLILKSIDDITSADITGFTDGDYVWTAFKDTSWDVYRFTNIDLNIVDVSYAGTELTITTDRYVRLAVGSIIGITQVTGFSGFYKIASTELNLIKVEATGLTVASPFTEQDQIVVYTLRSQRAPHIDVADQYLPLQLKTNELIWTDDSGSAAGKRWAVWRNSPVYNSTTVSNSVPDDDQEFGRTVAMDLASKLLAVSIASGEIIVYDKASPNAQWIQRQTIDKPFISLDPTPQADNIFAQVIAMSDDGLWLATGTPSASYVTSTVYDNLSAVDAEGTTSNLENQGVVSLYRKDTNNIYSLVYTIVSPAPANDQFFGSKIVFGNNEMYISAPGFSSGLGKIYKVSYKNTQKAITAYNPVGSEAKTVKVASTTNITAGMTIQGIGFSTQTVIDVIDSTTIIISSAPDSDPAGLLTFSILDWGNDTAITAPAPSDKSKFGKDFTITSDKTTLVVSGNITVDSVDYGEVYVFTDGTLTQTISPRTNISYGQSISIASDGSYLAVADIFADGTKIDQGAVTVYEKVGTLYDDENTRSLTNVSPETAGFFGSKVFFMNNFKTLAVYVANADTFTQTTFNVDQAAHPTESGNPTTFDKSSTRIGIKQPDSGRIDIYDRYANNWIFSESLVTTSQSNEGYGSNIMVSRNTIFVSAPHAYVDSFKSGVLYEYSKSEGAYSWTIKDSEIEKPDVTKIRKAFLYNKSTNELITYLDVVDPTQGKIPGPANEEIKYKTYYDPAYYSTDERRTATLNSELNYDDGTAWTTRQVGALWWDLRTVKFVDSYDSDIVYRNSNWNTLAPGASVNVYEWVETTYLPSDWDAIADTETGLAQGISGTSLYGNSAYSVRYRYDNISKTRKSTYYYWVKNKKTIPSVSGRYISAQDVADLIANPRGEGYQYLALTGSNSFSLVNIKNLLEDNNVLLSVEYWTVDNPTQNVHSQWTMISNDPNTQLPVAIEQKWFDSLCGKDLASRVVPDPSLPPKLKYGIENRPRQSMFVNRFEALKQFVEQVNLELISTQLVGSRSLATLEMYDPEPSDITGLYDTAIDTEAELRFANVGSFRRPSISILTTNGRVTGISIVDRGNGYLVAPYIQIVGSGEGAVVRAKIDTRGRIVGADILSAGHGYDTNTAGVVRDYSILVRSDSQALSRWSVYSYDPSTLTWSRIQSQMYDTRRYWSYVDWYATGYNQFTAISHAVNTLVDLNSLIANVGDVVKVRTDNNGNWILLEKYASSTSIDWTQNYKVVGSQNGTIQLSNTLYNFSSSSSGYDASLYDAGIFDSLASVELRNILNALKNDIFIDDLRTQYLNLFFTSVRYALSEQNYVDWIFKTSFVKAQHNVGSLSQPVTYRNDNLANFEDYITEVKPYRTKVREYISSYSKVDNSQMSVTDFDLSPVYENDKITTIDTIVQDGQIIADNPTIQTYPWKNWLDNVGFEIVSLELVDSGSGYLTEPVVRIISDSGTGATGRAFIANGKVNRVVLLTSGKGYLSAPTIVIDGGLSSTGVAARAVAIIGNSVVRSNLIKIKFDRISQTYYITQLKETETFVGTGSRLQFALKWAPDIRVGQSSVTIDGVDALRDNYTLSSVKSTSKGFTSYSGSITFDTPIAKGAVVVVTYLKNWATLNAADRIQYYYNPEDGDLGRDLAQLMTGIDYGGVIVSGLGFDLSGGWGSLPYYTDKWGSTDEEFDDYIVTVGADNHTFTLPYIPTAGTEINVYHSTRNVDHYVSDGIETTYNYNFLVTNPTASVSRTVPMGDVLATYVSYDEEAVTLEVNNTTGIQAGMTIRGNGFASDQFVISVDDSTTLTINAAPNTTPLGSLRFTRNIAGSTVLLVNSTTGINLNDVVTNTTATGTATATNSTGNKITLNTTAGLVVGEQIKFKGTTFGNLTSGTYWITSIVGSTITVSLNKNGSNIVLSSASGSMTFTVVSTFGYNTKVTSIDSVNKLVTLDQIIVKDIPAGSTIVFSRDLIVPTDVTIYDNGTIVLTSPVTAGSDIYIAGTLPSARIDDPNYDAVISAEDTLAIKQSELLVLEGEIATLNQQKVVIQGNIDNVVDQSDAIYDQAVDLYALILVTPPGPYYNGLVYQLNQLYSQLTTLDGVYNLLNSQLNSKQLEIDAKQVEINAKQVEITTAENNLAVLTAIENDTAVMQTWIADGINNVITVPSSFVVLDADVFIFRKSTSDGSITPPDTDYDTALSGGNLAYSSATGLAAEDIIIDGDDFVTPTSSSAPEEVVPGQVVDAVAVKVYDKPTSGSAVIKVDNYIADGITTDFAFSQIPNSPQAVVVKLTDGDRTPELVSVTEITAMNDDYVVDYKNGLVKFSVAPANKKVVSLFSLGYNGSGVLDLDYFIGDGQTTEFVTKAPWLASVSSLVYQDGNTVNPELFKTDSSYDSAKRIGLRFSSAPPANSLISFVIVSGAEQTFAVTKTERIRPTQGQTTYDLQNKIGDALPAESNMIVRVDQTILKGPNNSYFQIKNNKLNYTLDPTKYLPYSVDISGVVVLADGVMLDMGTDYTVDLSGITIRINKVTYKNYAGKTLIVSIGQENGYTYIPGVGTQAPMIVFTQEVADTFVSYDPGVADGSLVEVISSYKHDILDVQRTAVNVTSSLSLTPDTVEYYYYRSVLGGKLVLDRTVINDNYVWVIKNGTLLTPSFDFKLLDDKKTIKLAFDPVVTDEFALITYGSNVWSAGIAYMQFKDMLNRVHFKRLNANKQTRLSKELRYNDLTIEVEDASQFDEPNPSKNKPGVIEIRGERIEFFKINGNVLGQLRRGTLGTGTPEVHNVGSFVQDIGPSENIPYSEEFTTEEVVSDGTNTVNLSFVPGGFDTTWTYKGSAMTSEDATALAKSAVEIFVGGYNNSSVWSYDTAYAVDDIVNVGSYTYRCVTAHTSTSAVVNTIEKTFFDDIANWTFFVGNIRLKKEPYKVHNVNQAEYSPEGDVQLAADFAVDGTSSEIQLTHKLSFGTQVTVVKRTGTDWDRLVNIQTDDSKIAKFLKAAPGVWYTDIRQTGVSGSATSFDNASTRFDDTNITFDQG